MAKKKNKKKVIKEKEVLSKQEVQEVWDYYKFAKGAGIVGMPLTPDLMSQRMKDISLLSTGEVTAQQVEDALSAPKQSEEELRRQSEAFEITSSLYKRLLSYMGNMLSFDFTYTCQNATYADYKKGAADGKSSPYKKDLKIFADFMDSFDHKAEFNKIVRQIMRNEAYFSAFRDEGKKFVFQELPADRTKITGRWDRGLLFSFDYYYFLQSGVDIDMYPAVMKKTMNKLSMGGAQTGTGTYDPATDLVLRGNRGFVYWVDCSPKDGFWMFKMTPEIATRIPFFAGLFPDLVKENVIRALQESSYMAAASKIIMGQVPMLDAKAKVKDMISITPELLGKFLALVQSALNSTAVKVAASPLENVKGFDFKSDNDIRSSAQRTTLSSSGVSANLLFSSDAKLTSIEAQLSLAVDEALMLSVLPQFEEFINYQVNERTKKFKFQIKFEGTNFFTDKERKLDEANSLADKGIVLPQKFAVAVGMSPFEMQRQMDEARASGWVDNLTPIVNAAQLSKEEGRPAKSDSELGEAGSQTRDSGSNDDK